MLCHSIICLKVELLVTQLCLTLRLHRLLPSRLLRPWEYMPVLYWVDWTTTITLCKKNLVLCDLLRLAFFFFTQYSTLQYHPSCCIYISILFLFIATWYPWNGYITICSAYYWEGCWGICRVTFRVMYRGPCWWFAVITYKTVMNNYEQVFVYAYFLISWG